MRVDESGKREPSLHRPHEMGDILIVFAGKDRSLLKHHELQVLQWHSLNSLDKNDNGYPGEG